MDIPKERRALFKTRNGRPVYDGGGVSPDILVAQAESIPEVRALQDQGIVLNYVTAYCKDKPSLVPVESYHCLLQTTDAAHE